MGTRKLYQTLFIIFVGFLLSFSAKPTIVFAGECTNFGACGPLGGCASGELCSSGNCVPSVSCTQTSCTPACNSNEVCSSTSGGYKCVPRETIINCGGSQCASGQTCQNVCGGQYCAAPGFTPNSQACVRLTSDAINAARDAKAADQKGGFLQLLNIVEFPADDSLAQNFMQLLYKALLPIAILIGMLLLVSSGYKLISSQGDPQKVMEAKEDLTSAIMGIIFIILGVSLLRVIISTLIGI